ncbi:rho-related protein racA-like [Nematostella vectensis]|uniref:rho-related protein racA-like n=1 Tax=Nematostella vectensis TaxID=45351 RepID=UPI0020779C03|nr:rho-related protein racA-like [Nematostella vectensis]
MVYQPLKLVLVGDAGIGKSTLIAKCHETHPTSAECGGFFAKTFDRSAEYKPTTLKAYSTNVYSNPTGRIYSVYSANIVDTGGSTVLDYVRPLAYIHADLFILCFDVTNRASFENVASKWFPEIRLYEKKVPLMLVGLKPNPVEKRKVSKADAERMLTRLKGNGSYFEVDSFNPKEDEASKLFEAAVEQAFQHYQTLSDRHLKNREKKSSKDPSFDITNLSEPSPPPKTKFADSTLREDWKSTQERHESADVTIRFKNIDSVMTAHSFVLAVTSESFKELLCSLSSFGGEKAVEHLSPFREAKTKARDTIGSKVLYDITFEESIKPEAMNSVLAWMYTGHLDLKCKDLQSIGEAASTLKIKPLALLCEQSLKKKPPHPPPPPPLPPTGNPPRLPLPSIVNRRLEAVVVSNYLREAFLRESFLLRSGFPPPTRMQAPKPSKKNTNTGTDLDPEAAHRSAWVKSTKDLFLNKALLSDITFVVKGVSVPAHRVVLITRSAVMAAMLDGKFRENDLAMIELPDVPLAPFLILLEYIYTDSCNLKDTNAREVLVLADRFCLDGLAARCEQFIIDSMPGLGVICDNEEFVESILDVFMFAKAFNSQYLTMWCLHVIATNYTIFEKTPEYNTILKENREYIEANRWLPRSYLKILNSYRARGTIVIPERIQRHCPKHCGCTIL